MTTHRTITVLGTAASTFLIVAVSAPAQAQTTAPGCVAIAPTTSDVADVVAARKAQAAQYAVDHRAELAR